MRFLLFSLLLVSGCYSFRGITVPEGAKTFHFMDFTNKANQVVPGLMEDFSERLKNKIRNNTKLTYTESEDADIIFEGIIQDYRVTSKASQANQQSAISQLDLNVHITYTYEKDEKIGWDRTFRQQEEFDAGDNLLDVQDVLNEALTKQLVEDIFNAAFAEKW